MRVGSEGKLGKPGLENLALCFYRPLLSSIVADKLTLSSRLNLFLSTHSPLFNYSQLIIAELKAKTALLKSVKIESVCVQAHNEICFFFSYLWNNFCEKLGTFPNNSAVTGSLIKAKDNRELLDKSINQKQIYYYDGFRWQKYNNIYNNDYNKQIISLVEL